MFVLPDLGMSSTSTVTVWSKMGAESVDSTPVIQAAGVEGRGGQKQLSQRPHQITNTSLTTPVCRGRLGNVVFHLASGPRVLLSGKKGVG